MSAPVTPIPDGHHTLTAYLVVPDTAAAIDFYAKALGATEVFRMPGPGGRIVHAEVAVGDSRFYLCDEMPEMGGKSPRTLGGTPVSLFLWSDDVDAAFARATGAGATVKMPLDDMFWGDRFGIVVDPFGHEWQMATHKEDLTPEEMAARGAAAMAAMG
jgi:PhnB protein